MKSYSNSIEFPLLSRCILFLFFVFCEAPFVFSSDWPQAGCNPQRTAFTPDQPNAPYEFLWTIFLPAEGDRISTKVQVIAHGGRAFFGTRKGVLWAVDPGTGKPSWKTQLGGVIDHSPAAAEGLVFQGCLDGYLYAIESESGKPVWQTDLGSGISVAPLLAAGNIYIGAREGVFYAISQKDGNILWKTAFDAPIMQCAAYDDGSVYVGAEDLKIRRLDANDGRIIWTSRALNGQSLRGYYPVVHKGKVFIGQGVTWSKRTLNWGQASGSDDDAWMKLWEQYGLYGHGPVYEKLVNEKPVLWADLLPELVEMVRETSEKRAKAGRHGTVVVLDANTGEDAYVWGAVGTQRMNDVIQPPAFTRAGLAVHSLTITGHPCDQGLFDPGTGALMGALLGRVSSGDENQDFSVGGDVVFSVHLYYHGCGTFQAWNLGTGACVKMPIPPVLGGGVQLKCATSSSAVSISGPYIFHVAKNHVSAWKGVLEAQ